MKKSIFIFFFLFPFIGSSQIDELKQIEANGNSNFNEGNYPEARYYFKLGLRKIKDDITADSLKNIFVNKISIVDSTEAYQSKNISYIQLLKESDSLSEKGEILIALQKLKLAHDLIPEYPYCYFKIDQLIENNPEIKKKLIVISINKNYQSLIADMEIAKALEDKNEMFSALNYFEKMKLNHVHNEKINQNIIRIRNLIKDEINEFDSIYKVAVIQYDRLNYNESRAAFQIAKSINFECRNCMKYITRIDFLIEKDSNTIEITNEELLDQADANFNIGKYELAEHQYIIYQKKMGKSEAAQSRIIEIETILKNEQDQKRKIINLKLLFERADKLFYEGNVKTAKELYFTIMNRYTEYEDVNYLKNRIAQCNALLDQ